MTQASILPTQKDEDWRYADFAALDGVEADSVTEWREVSVPAGETYNEIKLACGSDASVERVAFTVGEGARVSVFAVIAGSAYARFEVAVRLAKGAHFEFGGVTIGGDIATREFVTRVEHAEPEATSNQVIRSVHWEGATGNFLGRIEVARDAQKTDAGQDFKALLLERGASANAKPELEIFADDVKCAHGAAIGQLDETARFYMAARGIAPDVARDLLVRAFLADAFVALDNADDQDALLQIALASLAEPDEQQVMLGNAFKALSGEA